MSLLREGGSYSSLLPRPRGEYGSFYLRLGTMCKQSHNTHYVNYY